MRKFLTYFILFFSSFVFAQELNCNVVVIAQQTGNENVQVFKNLEKQGLKQTDSKGEVFDADIHEAITNIPAPSEDMKGKIVDVIERGYTLNDKVIRFPKVVVGQ